MPRPPAPRWYWVPLRILLITFLTTLLTFALSMLVGIIGVLVIAKLRGVAPNMTLAYRRIAIPTAGLAALLTLVAATVSEVRHYRQSKALAGIERAG
jgi:hypothetical protein